MNNTIQISTLDFPFNFCKKGQKAIQFVKRASLKMSHKSQFLTGAFKESQKTQASNAIIHKEGYNRSGN